MKSFKTALIQMPVTEDKSANISTAAGYVREAARQGAQITVLPEMFCCPYDSASFVRNAEP